MTSGILSGAQSGRRVQLATIFLLWIPRNPLKSPESAKGIQGNPRNFPWFCLHFLARNSPPNCVCDASSSVSSGLPFGSPRIRRLGRQRAFGAGRRQKTPELSLRGCQFQPIGMRSEVTGDAETTLEAAAVALPSARNKCATAEDRSDVAARRILLHVLIHHLEVEVQVGDRVPADVRANEISEGMRRDEARADAERRPALAGPVDPADRALVNGLK
jgi:hypothetical protein